jgi:hypothetical protein
LIGTASPIAAVEASYQQVGRALADIFESTEPGAAAGLNVAQLARAAHARGLISTENLDAVEGLGVMHTIAVLDTNGERLEPAKAREFVALAEAVLYALRTQVRPDDNSATARTDGAGASAGHRPVLFARTTLLLTFVSLVEAIDQATDGVASVACRHTERKRYGLRRRNRKCPDSARQPNSEEPKAHSNVMTASMYWNTVTVGEAPRIWASRVSDWAPSTWRAAPAHASALIARTKANRPLAKRTGRASSRWAVRDMSSTMSRRDSSRQQGLRVAGW